MKPMELVKNYCYYLLYFFIIINITIGNLIGIDASADCEKLARQFIQLKEAHRYYVDDCQFVEVHFDEYTEAHNLKVFIQSLTGKVLETLNLYEASGVLAHFSTPIYLSHVQSLKVVRRLVKVANYIFNKTTIGEFAQDLGYFTFYHDIDKLASMIYLYKSPLDVSLEGNVGNYVLRRLPGNRNNGYFQYVYVRLVENNESLQSSVVPPQGLFSLNSSVVSVNAELFVLLDLQDHINKTPTELIKIVLMYYNYIAMLYSNFESPEIFFTIKGIVIPEINNPNPYIESISPYSTELYYQQASKLTEFIHNHKEYFNINNHCIVTLMTERLIYRPSITNPKISRIETISDHRICDNDGPSIFILFHVNFQAGHSILLSRLVYLFTSPYFQYSITKDCSNSSLNIQEENLNLPYWPSCIIKEYAKYFKSNSCTYFNKL